MRSQIVRLANYAHTIVNPFGRRALLVLAVLGLCIYETIKWIGIVLFIVIYPFLCLVIGFCKGVAEVPSYTINQMRYDKDTWRSDAAGIHRIWCNFKPGDNK